MSQSVADLINLIYRKVPTETSTAQQEATKVMYKVRRCVFNVNHLQELEFLNAYGKTVKVKSDKLIEIPGGLTFFQLICKIDSIDTDPHIFQKKSDL